MPLAVSSTIDSRPVPAVVLPRLRMGIGRPEVGDPIDWVLSPFNQSEAQDLPLICEVAGGIVLDAARLGVQAAMNLHNGRGAVPSHIER